MTFVEALLNAKQLLAILPHRYPFLLVDRILELEPGKRIVGMKNVTLNEPFFVGHFPGHPIMPGVLILEMMAQVGGVLLLAGQEKQGGKLALLTGVDKSRFRKPVLPGDTIRAEVLITKARGNMGWVKGVVDVDGAVVCEAEMSFALVDRDANL